MSTSELPAREVLAVSVSVDPDSLSVDLNDGRTISVPLAWYPRLSEASPGERARWSLVGGGQGIHWPDVDEDISIRSLLGGHPSAESAESLKRWLRSRSPR